MNRYPQGWLVGHVEKVPAAGGEHAIIRQRRVETAINNHGACTAKQRRRRNWQIPRRMFSRPTKAKRSEVASSKFGRAARTESLPAPKNFLQKRLSHKGYPLYAGRTIFGQVFGRGAVTKISK